MPKHYHMKAETGKIFDTPGDAKMKAPASFTFPINWAEFRKLHPNGEPLTKFHLRIPMMGAFIHRRSVIVREQINETQEKVIFIKKVWQVNSYINCKVPKKLLTEGVRYTVTIQ